MRTKATVTPGLTGVRAERTLSPSRESLLPCSSPGMTPLVHASSILRHGVVESFRGPTVPLILSGRRERSGLSRHLAGPVPTPPASVPWMICCCCCRIPSTPKPLVSSGSSKSQGLGTPRLAPPVIRLDLKTGLNVSHNSKNIALLQITPTSAEVASLTCFENSIKLQCIAPLVYASNHVQC